MNRNRPFRSLGFRLGAIYALLFSVSVLVLLAVCFVIVSSTVRDQLKRSISEEVAELAEEYVDEGRNELLREIDVRRHLSGAEDRYYLFCNSAGTPLAGNLGTACPPAGWSTKVIVPNSPGNDKPAISEPRTLEIFGQPLADGSFLAVGEDEADVVETERAIVSAFGWAIIMVSIMAIAGGAALSRSFLRRIDAINATAQGIIAGDLKRRVAVGSDNDEIDALSTNLNAMLDRIGMLMDSLRQVSNDVAHDLRTPLTRLRQRLDVANGGNPSKEELMAVIERAHEDIDSILETFAAVLRIAQLEGGVSRAGFVNLDLSGLLNGLVETYRPVADDSGHRLDSVIAPDITVTGDRQQLTQLFANLIENAIRHTPKGSVARVELSAAENGQIRAIVADNGPGIPANMREKVFQRFYRLESSRSLPGSGLGLALVKAIAVLHGAVLSLEDSRPGVKIILNFNRVA